MRGTRASAACGLALLVGLLLLVAGAVEAQSTVPGAPTIDTVTAGSGTTLVVTWTAPSNDGGSTITAYDVRYIKTADDETDGRQLDRGRRRLDDRQPDLHHRRAA